VPDHRPQSAFSGVLGLLAAVEVIDWPVAVAIGVGQASAARHFSDRPAVSAKPAGEPASQDEDTGRCPAATPAGRPPIQGGEGDALVDSAIDWENGDADGAGAPGHR
jgi:hypothetical protein